MPSVVLLSVCLRSVHESGLPSAGKGLKGCLWFAALIFYGVGGGKLPISVRLGAKLTRIQFTRLPDGRATVSTRNG